MTAKHTTFYLSYDGPEHATHEMDVLDLARYLEGAGKMLYEADRLINGRTTIEVKVKAGFAQGSFGIGFEVIQLFESAKDILPLIGIGSLVGAGSALEVIRKFRGRSIEAVERKKPKKGEDPSYRLKAGDVDIECEKDIKRLITNKTFRSAVDDMVGSVVENKGTTSFKIVSDMDDDTPIHEVSRLQAADFSVPENLYKETIETKIKEAQVKFRSAHTDKPGEWRVEISGKVHTVRIEDQAFLERMQGREEPYIFGKTFTVRLQSNTTSKATFSRKSTKYTILRVFHESR